MANAREIALKALIEYRRRGAWPDLYLKQALTDLSPEDTGLATALVSGVIQRMLLLDFYIAHYSTIKLKKIMPQVLDILRMGVHQLCFFQGRMPDYAVVNESVKLARKHANPQAAGFVNSLLRTVSRQLDALPQPGREDAEQYLSVTYSFPVPLVRRLVALLGEAQCEAFMACCNEPPQAAAWVNTLKLTTQALAQSLNERGLDAQTHEHLTDAIKLRSLAGVGQWPELREGLLYIMGEASQACVEALDPQPGSRLVDLCAAPGGKTLLAARNMAGRGSILAMDVHPHKADLLERNSAVYGFDGMVQTVAADASVFRPALADSADYIICDVPCSGYGIIQKKPDIRYKPLQEMGGLPALQAGILACAGRYLKPGGTVVYSTCTVLPEENEAVVADFLAGNPGFQLEAFQTGITGAVPTGMIQLWPHIHGTDGFFMAKIRKRLEL